MKNGEKAPKVLVTRKLTDAAEQAFEASFDCAFNSADKPMTSQEIIGAAQGFDAIAMTSMDKFPFGVIDALPASIRIIATVSAGHEHIDHLAARARGIVTTNTPGVLTDATADIALLLMLGAARGAHWGERMVREDRWPPPSMVKPLGLDVSGKRLGILGMGRIGQAVAKRARAFGMTIHYHNRNPIDDGEAEGATYHARFEDMLPHCDFLSINCAMTPETKGIINNRTLSLLPRGAVVVNTARGGIVDDDALIAALTSGHIGAAGLDVFANEPAIDPRYRSLENAFLLPHIGSATLNTRTAMGMLALDNLKDFFAGKRPRNQFN